MWYLSQSVCFKKCLQYVCLFFSTPQTLENAHITYPHVLYSFFTNGFCILVLCKRKNFLFLKSIVTLNGSHCFVPFLLPTISKCRRILYSSSHHPLSVIVIITFFDWQNYLNLTSKIETVSSSSFQYFQLLSLHSTYSLTAL